MKPRGVPAEAEELDLIPHIRNRRRPSRYVPGYDQLFPELVCPACQAVEPLPKYEEVTVCNCGLSRLMGANRIYVWRTAKVFHAVG